MLRHVDGARGIEKSEYADGGVQHETKDGLRRAHRLALQDLVGEGDQIVEIGEEVVDTVADRTRHDEAIGLDHRNEDHLIEVSVEKIDTPVPALPGVIDVDGKLGIGIITVELNDRRLQHLAVWLRLVRGAGRQQQQGEQEPEDAQRGNGGPRHHANSGRTC